MADPERFQQAIAAIDAVNAADPTRVMVRGEERPKELAHSELVTAWVEELVPDPSEELLLAARAHHIRRWAIPRASYPDGRAGYLKWRRALHDVHAEEVAGVLGGLGYPDEAVARVQELVRKQGLGRVEDPEMQALEDALCLVFVETQFHDLAARLDDEKMVEVVVKTLRKMSADAQELALALPLAEGDAALVARAVREIS